MGAEGMKKVQARSNSPKVVIGKQLANKKKKSTTPPKIQSCTKDTWYATAWSRFSISANGSAYQAERTDELSKI